jgi:ABC-type sugar transport system ATPase subunit
MLELEAVSKRYGSGVWALRSVSLRVAPGERIGVVGPSGVGKSTLLRIIAGLETPTSGRVWIGGRDVTEVPPHLRGVGLVAQQAALFPHWSVRRNLALGLATRALPRDETRRQTEEMARRIGVHELLDRHPVGLSGGQQKRIALGRALLSDPRILLLDEPFGSLDAPLRLALASELTTVLDQTRVSAILVTHDVAEALSSADRLMVLLDGAVAQAGPTHDVYRRPATLAIARFLGDPPCSVLSAQVELREGRRTVLFGGDSLGFTLNTDATGTIDLASDPAPGLWRIGIRPEHVGLFRERLPGDSSRIVQLPVRVRAVLLRGPAALTELELGSGMLRAWTPPDSRWAPGDHGFAAFDPARLLWYEPAQGQLVHAGGPG